MRDMEYKLYPSYDYLGTVSTDYGLAGPAGIKTYEGTCTELLVEISDVPECVLEKLETKYDEYAMDPSKLMSLKVQGKAFSQVFNQTELRLIVDKFEASEWLSFIRRELKAYNPVS